MGGGGYVAGPGRAGGRAGARPARAHRGRQPPRADQPPAGAPRPARLPRVPDRRPRRATRYLVTGRPIPPPATDRDAARARFGLDVGRPLRARVRRLAGRALDQPGGARGPRRRALPRPARRRRARLRRACSGGRGEGYDLREYIDGFGEALLAADLCVARAGGSIFEIAAHGLPAILVPYPHAAGDHQTANARWMADGGAAVVVPDADLTPARLRAEVDALLGDPGRLAAMARAARALARPDAAARIAAEVLSAAS